MASIHKVAPLLDSLSDGTRVAVVTLLGSLCPITRAHVMGFFKAREIFLGAPGVVRPAGLETFGEVIGFISCNGDRYVSGKDLQGGFIEQNSRLQLAAMAVAEYPWIDTEHREGCTLQPLRERWPKLTFIRYHMNGADDVAKHSKWLHANEKTRFITMGRPGDTEKVRQGIQESQVDPRFCILGPELPDISSTQVREALQLLANALHPGVAKWCLTEGPYAPQPSAAPAAATAYAAGYSTPTVAPPHETLPQYMVHHRHDGLSSTLLRSKADMSREYCIHTEAAKVQNGQKVELCEPRAVVNGLVRVRFNDMRGWLKREYLHE